MSDALVVSKPLKTLADQVYEAIKADLLAGALPAGTALLTRDLLNRYGCGISPLREALARLVGEQFLEAASHRGVRVPAPSILDVDDVYRIRIVLEREALALALRHGDHDWEGEIVSACHRLERAPLPSPDHELGSAMSEWEARHRAFHTSLIAAAPAPRLLRLIDQMVDQTERYRAMRLAHVDQFKLGRDIVAEHRELMQKAIARDTTCLDLLAEHLDHTRTVVAEILRSQDL